MAARDEPEYCNDVQSGSEDNGEEEEEEEQEVVIPNPLTRDQPVLPWEVECNDCTQLAHTRFNDHRLIMMHPTCKVSHAIGYESTANAPVEADFVPQSSNRPPKRTCASSQQPSLASPPKRNKKTCEPCSPSTDSFNSSDFLGNPCLDILSQFDIELLELGDNDPVLPSTSPRWDDNPLPDTPASLSPDNSDRGESSSPCRPPVKIPLSPRCSPNMDRNSFLPPENTPISDISRFVSPISDRDGSRSPIKSPRYMPSPPPCPPNTDRNYFLPASSASRNCLSPPNSSPASPCYSNSERDSSRSPTKSPRCIPLSPTCPPNADHDYFAPASSSPRSCPSPLNGFPASPCQSNSERDGSRSPTKSPRFIPLSPTCPPNVDRDYFSPGSSPPRSCPGSLTSSLASPCHSNSRRSRSKSPSPSHTRVSPKSPARPKSSFDPSRH